jgi:uncharacterized protein YecT (DUF1311 family)
MLGKQEMHLREIYWLALLFLIVALPCWAQDDLPDVCKQYSAVPLPAEAAVATPAEFPACNSYKSYAGIGHDADFTAARHCAWQERAANKAQLAQNPKAPIAWTVGGSLILADIYANGLGTSQNIPLAARLICEDNGLLRSEAVADLEAHKVGSEKPAKPFELCDYAATTFEMNFCGGFASERENDTRERTIAKLSNGWTPAAKTAFAVAEQAFDNYARSVARNETYQGGTIRNLRSNAVEQQLRRTFVLDLQNFESGALPSDSADSARQADTELNLVYRTAMDAAQALKPHDPEEVQPEGIRDTERLWLRYRDDWISFAKLRYPATKPDIWLGQTTRTRTEQLEMVACGLDAKSSVCTPAILRRLQDTL